MTAVELKMVCCASQASGQLSFDEMSGKDWHDFGKTEQCDFENEQNGPWHDFKNRKRQE